MSDNFAMTLQKCILKLLKILISFVFVYFLLIFFIFPVLSGVLICRFALSIIFKVFYKERFKLLESENGIHAPNFPNSVYTISSFLFISGPLDIPWLQQRIWKIFTGTRKPDGSYAYERMKCKLVKKFGFYCWEKAEFDISHHIRLFPGLHSNKVYSEKEVFEAAAKLADTPWEDSHPWWEFLIVPQMRKEGSGEICSVIHKRIHHAYGDGNFACFLIHECIGDQPTPPLVLDPVNPGFEIPLYLRLMSYLQVFFLGPSVLLRFAFHKEKHVFYEGPLKGCKFLGRATLPVSLEKMRSIRKHYETSTTAVQHFALTGALQKYAQRRSLPIPEDILGAIVTALVPYPDYYPQNRFMMFLERFPVGEKDPFRRLCKINKICKRCCSPVNYYIALTSRLLNKTVGILPAGLIEKLVVLVQLSYCISNMPGGEGKIFVNGNLMKDAIGIGPLLNGMGFVMGVGYYNETFEFGFQSEKCELIKNREELLELITDFENEISFLLNNIESP